MKKIKYLMISVFAFMLSFPVLAKDTGACKKALKVSIDEKIPNTVHIIVLALQIVVPILLVIFGMIDLIKAIVAGKEDEIKKAQGIFIRRLITGVLVFFVIVIVKLVFSFATNGDGNGKSMWDCVDVFLNGVN